MKESQTLTDNLYCCLNNLSSGHRSGEIIILESQHPNHPESKQTYVAAFSSQYIALRGTEIEWKNGDETVETGSDLWEEIKRFRESAEWVFGYFGYDLAVPDGKRDPQNKLYYEAPGLFLMEPTVLFRIDENGVEQLLGDKVEINQRYERTEFSVKDVTPAISKEKYIRAIETIKEQIAEGEFYELNFSYPITATFGGSSYELYRKMREISPVPFASYIEFDSLSVCCSSPERFLQKKGTRLISEPIKGTAARGKNREEDDRYRDELKSEKNEAENLMIVDLVRHDLSTVCKPGSIKVSKLFEIQTFGTVHQLISRVEGTIADDSDPADAIRACFPMGSMTGAPKIRVMQHTEELENYRRGIYSGAIGYMSPNGDFDFNVVIRSAILSGNRLTYPVGGAITGDSDPEEEWIETRVKSKVLHMVQN